LIIENGEWKIVMIKRGNVLKEKSFSFALQIIKLYKYLANEKKEYIIAKQVLRSGISVGAMIEEANQAESKADFIHKLSIANKEANETHYWLRLLKESEYISDKHFQNLIIDNEELMKLLTSSIKTSKKNLAN
jgi:four helix bundle protein